MRPARIAANQKRTCVRLCCAKSDLRELGLLKARARRLFLGGKSAAKEDEYRLRLAAVELLTVVAGVRAGTAIQPVRAVAAV